MSAEPHWQRHTRSSRPASRLASDPGIVMTDTPDDLWFDSNIPPIDQELPRRNGRDNVRFRFTQFRDIQPSTAPAYVVDKLIPRLGVVVVWGKPKCGKTFWTFDLEMHVALGWPYRGRRVEQGEVLHIACEGVAGLGTRKEAWRLHHIKAKSNTEIEAIDNAPFHLCKDTALDLIKDSDTVVNDIITQFGDRSIKIVTIDTLNRSLRGSESKDDDMAAYVRAATLLAEKFQCVVIIIHHCGHNEARPRGHSSLLGAVDALIEIKKNDTSRVLSEVEEMRDGPTGETTVSRLDVVNVTYDVNGEPITSCVIVPDDTAATTSKPPEKTKLLSAASQIALQQLRNVLTTDGIIPPECRHIPTNRPAVDYGLWRRYCYAGGISDKDTPEAKKKAFARAAETLIAARVVGRWEQWVWLL
jgi:hypothetical protein